MGPPLVVLCPGDSAEICNHGDDVLSDRFKALSLIIHGANPTDAI
jgi:hypothetical protein